MSELKYDFNKLSKSGKEYKYQMLIRRAKEVIASYTDKLTIRQLYYRLVSSQDIENNRSQYVYYDDVLTEYRKQNLDFAEYFEDKTRKIISDISVYDLERFSEIINDKIENVKTDYPYFYINANLLQPKITVILLEKQALESIFQRAVGKMSILVVSRGFNSFTQLKELANLVKNDKRELNLYTFTDFDDSGLLIEQNFINQCKDHLGLEFNSITRIALTKEYIEANNIPTNPTKTSTHSQFNLPYFVELDAIEPNELKTLVKDVCKLNFDKDLENAIRKAFRVRNRRLKKAYFRELKKIDLSKIGAD